MGTGELIFGLAAFLIAASAFAYGAFRLFRGKKPLYLQLFVCAAGCYALEQLSLVVGIWCGTGGSARIGMLGIFGCNFFLLSANYGTLDRIVDDGKGKEAKKARLFAAAAPVVLAAAAAAAFLSWRERDLLCAVLWAVILFPALPASYFNLKHILLPMDPFEFLRATRPCNIAALVFYFMTAAGAVCSALGDIAGGAILILTSLSVLALVLCAVGGAKKWGI